MINSKKGALFHWIIIAIIAALGAFLLMSYNTDTGVKIKGEWQADYLNNYYLAGEKALLQNDQLALLVGKETVALLTKQGGVSEGRDCPFYYLREGEKACFQDLQSMVNTAFNELMENYDGGKYKVTFEKEELIGEAEDSVVINSNRPETKGQYTVKKHFRVKVGYDFSKFVQLQS